MNVPPKRRITPLQVSRGTPYAGRSPEPAPAFGATTNRFFEEGEEHETNHWQDIVLPPDDEPEERVQSGSFDKVPRNRGAMVAVTLFGICLAAAVGFGARALLQGGRTVETATIELASGGVLQPSEAPVQSALPVVVADATAPTEAALPTGLVARLSPATSADDGVKAGLEGPPAAAAAPAPPETSAAAAVPSDRKLRVDEGREPAQSAETRARQPHLALKTARRRASPPALAEPTPGESLQKSGTPELKLDSWSDEASDVFGTGALIPPRFDEPSAASTNTGEAAGESAPPAPEKLPATTGDPPADPAAAVGSSDEPFELR